MLPPDLPTIFKTHLLPKHVLSLSLQFLLPSSKGPGSHFTPPPPLKRHHCYLFPSTVHSEAKIPLLSLLVCYLIMTLSRVPQSFPSYLIIDLYLLTLFHWRSNRFPTPYSPDPGPEFLKPAIPPKPDPEPELPKPPIPPRPDTLPDPGLGLPIPPRPDPDIPLPKLDVVPPYPPDYVPQRPPGPEIVPPPFPDISPPTGPYVF